ncbi:FAD-dependent oxidoreductase [Kribbella sp. NPDC050820]|uniref:NAD(P)/FAD-dependent oxidoreductase n=1 Tax=Kribbella sp. NPDC050820 TaxID=3155408 RepID=UPI0033DAC02A
MISPSAWPRRSFDCIVIGLGVVGASVTRELARQGLSVLAVDRAQGVGGGCSYANAAILAPSHVTPLATPALLREAPVQMVRRPPAVRVRPDLRLLPWLGRLASAAGRADAVEAKLRDLAFESTQLHCQLASDGLNPTLRKTGALDVFMQQPRRRQTALLTAVALRQREPALARVVAGTYDSEEWTLESRSFVTSMLADADAAGAVTSFGTTVERVVIRSGRVAGVQVDGREIPANHVVLAAGLQSAELAAQAGVRLPLRGGRGHVVDVSVPHRGPKIPVRLKEHRIVITPLDDRVRVCGAIEFGKETRPVDQRRGEALRELAIKVLPVLADCPVVDRWSGERPCTWDGVPVIGMSNLVPNLAVATGHGMWGMILAPITGRLVSQAIANSSPTEDWLSPDRFTPKAAMPRQSGSSG